MDFSATPNTVKMLYMKHHYTRPGLTSKAAYNVVRMLKFVGNVYTIWLKYRSRFLEMFRFRLSLHSMV